MRNGLILLFFISFNASAQWTASISVYADTVKFLEFDETFDPSDFYSQGEFFHRVGLAYDWEKFSIGGYYDFDIGLKPTNYELNGGYEVVDFLNAQFLFRNTSQYYLYGADITNPVYSYVDLRQAGVRLLVEKISERMRFGFSPEIRFGGTNHETFNYLMNCLGNCKNLEKIDFKSFGHLSVGAQANFEYMIKKYQLYSLDVFAEVHFYREQFTFEYQRRQYEWTLERLTLEEFERFLSSGNRLQLHFGIKFRTKE